MTKAWTILETGCKDAQTNMSIDAMLLEKAVPSESPTLHFYDWIKPSISYGYFIDPFIYLNEERIKARELELVRRPTGGGVIFHLWDFTFSAVFPASCPGYSFNTLENYLFIHTIIRRALAKFLNLNSIDGSSSSLIQLQPQQGANDNDRRHFCMAKPTVYDLCIEGKKVAGGAQRRTRKGYLHQGSISLLPPSRQTLEEMLLNPQIVQEMCASSYPLLGSSITTAVISQAKQDLKRCLIEAFVEAY